MSSDQLLQYVRQSVIGSDDLIDGPFGLRPIIYADYTASGRSLSFIEDYLDSVVRPLYANTHSESSATGRQTSLFREEARSIIAEAVGATDEHAVLFCGSGATHAIAKLIGVLGLRVPSSLDDRFDLTSMIPAAERPVVFVGPYEHHSNEIPWRESIADVVCVDEDAQGHVSLAHLEDELRRYQDRPLVIGSFSAASNVTGITTDSRAVSALLHRYGGLAFWDFAAAAPYVAMAMGQADSADLSYLDAIFFSPHKFIGGPGTPGVLVARRELFANRVPVVPGGGTVTYVSDDGHDYDAIIEHREEGGTPAIIESIRAGLVMQLKEAIGVEEIASREHALVTRAIRSWEANPAIDVLGSHEADRLSIVSFVIRHGDQHLHHNYVVALLNDLFGIQSRGGCSCAGPYGHRLLDIEPERSAAFQRQISSGGAGIKPGWVRVSFHYLLDEETFNYIVEAVNLIASMGHHLLARYRFEPESGTWRGVEQPLTPPMSLYDVSYGSGAMIYENRRVTGVGELTSYLDEARRLCGAAGTQALPRPQMTADFERLRWFPYPDEVRDPGVLAPLPQSVDRGPY